MLVAVALWVWVSIVWLCVPAHVAVPEANKKATKQNMAISFFKKHKVRKSGEVSL
jgi:hypothetical protein